MSVKQKHHLSSRWRRCDSQNGPGLRTSRSSSSGAFSEYFPMAFCRIRRWLP